MTAHTAVLAEDEAILRGELRDRVTRLWPSLQLVGEAGVPRRMPLARKGERVSNGMVFLFVVMPA